MYLSDSLRTAAVIPGQNYPANLPCGDNGCTTMVMKNGPLQRCPACRDRRRRATAAKRKARHLRDSMRRDAARADA